MKGYNPDIRPSTIPAKEVQVRIDFDVFKIQRVIDPESLFTVIGFFICQWTDDRLSWNTTDYNGTNVLTLNPAKVWLPDIGIINSYDGFFQKDFFEMHRATVNNKGTVYWLWGGRITATCKLDVTYFPRDRQACGLRLTPLAHTAAQVDLIAPEEVLTGNYEKSGEWDLEDIIPTFGDIDNEVISAKDEKAVVVFQFVLRRRLLFFLLNVIMPCAFVIIALLVTFWLPVDSGEKISLAVTSMLTFAVLLLVIADKTPQESTTSPILSQYLAIIMGVAALSLSTTAVVLNLHHSSSHSRPPGFVRNIVFKIMAKILCVNTDNVDDTVDKEIIGEVVDERGKNVRDYPKHAQHPPHYMHNRPGGPHHRNGRDVVHTTSSHDGRPDATMTSRVDPILRELREITHELKTRNRTQEISDEWRCLAAVIDRFCFWIIVIGLGIVSILFFYQDDPGVERLNIHE